MAEQPKESRAKGPSTDQEKSLVAAATANVKLDQGESGTRRFYEQPEVDALIAAAEAAALLSVIKTYQEMNGQNPHDQEKDPDCFISAITSLISRRESALSKIIQSARLEEAIWWESIVGIRHSIDQREDCEPDCPYCERLRTLRASVEQP